MPKKHRLTEFQKDILKETANIGSGRASTALSKLAGEEVKLAPPSVDFASIEKIPKLVRGRRRLVVGAYTSISGDVGGALVMMFPIKSALSLVSLLEGRKPSPVLGDADKAVLQEVSHFVSSAYLAALNEFLGIELLHSVPRVVSTFGESIIDFVLLDVGNRMKDGLLIQTNFVVKKKKIEGDLVLLMALESADTILKATKKWMRKL